MNYAVERTSAPRIVYHPNNNLIVTCIIFLFLNNVNDYLLVQVCRKHVLGNNVNYFENVKLVRS